MTTTSSAVRVIRSASWRALGAPVVGRFVRRFSHMIVGAPRWSPMRFLAPLRSKLKGEVSQGRVVEILAVLERSGLRYGIAGGCMRDALGGGGTRRTGR